MRKKSYSNKNKTRRANQFNWQKHKIISAREHQTAAKRSINNMAISAREGKVFVLSDGSKCVEFMCCSYLGLDTDDRIINAGQESLRKLGANIAVSRTRIRADRFDVLDSNLNKIFCNSHTTTFSSLHVLHAGMIPLIGSGELPSYPIDKNGCVFIIDKFAHASLQLVRAIMEQFGDLEVVNFQDHDAVIEKFSNAYKQHKTPVSISDSIISMGGIAPVLLLLELAEKYHGYVYLDDAHGTSILGKNGCGYTLDLLEGVFHPRLFLLASLSKGFGANGAVIVLPKQKDIDMVRTFCGPYIFGNPPPLAIVESAIASSEIHLSEEIVCLQVALWKNIKLFDSLMKDALQNYGETSPIRRILIGDELKTIQCAVELKSRGFLLGPSMFPSVEKGKAILRVVLSAAHTDQQIRDLADHIMDIMKQLRIGEF